MHSLQSDCPAHAGPFCMQITNKKKKTGVIAPKKFVQRLKRDNELFRSYMHQVKICGNSGSIRSSYDTNTPCLLLQDAHEFLYFLFNEISEVLEKSEKEKLGASQNGTSAQSDSRQTPPKTWVHELFQGMMVNEMRCMQCETVTSREEAFYDLSLEIEHNSSVTSCLRNFRSTPELPGDVSLVLANLAQLHSSMLFAKVHGAYDKGLQTMRVNRCPADIVALALSSMPSLLAITAH